MAELTPTLSFEDVEVGQKLPELVIELSPTVIVSTALASRDYQDVHHDRDLALKKGSKDIFMNILSSNGFVGRFITDWTGPNAIIKRDAQAGPSVLLRDDEAQPAELA